jgi:hypothetical protein
LTVRSDTDRAFVFYEQFYKENPRASIDMAAKAADKAGAPILKEVASEARRKVLEMAKKPEIDWKLLPENQAPGPKPFVPPAEWSKPKAVQPPEPAPEPTPAAVEEPEPDADGRKAFVNKMLDEDPSVHPTIIQAEMLKKFGKGMDHRYIYESARIAREQNGLPQIRYRVETEGRASPTPVIVNTPEPGPDPVSSAVRDFVAALKHAGIRPESFLLSINREWEVEFTYDRLISSSGKMKL